ncbi:MAG: ComEC/Rec2 family competence protein [Cyanobacteria bacterium J06623_7]
MKRIDGIVLALTFILSLLSTNWLDYGQLGWTKGQLSGLLILLIGTIVVSAIAISKTNRAPISIAIITLAVGMLGVVYFQLRTPLAQANDISYQVTENEASIGQVTGIVSSELRLNDSQRLKFWFEAKEINQETVTGKLYATLPLLQGTGIYPGQKLTLTGLLYLPQPANSPRNFDFQEYLAHRGSFAGIQGITASLESTPPSWGWWQLRQRIVRSHVRGLGSPLGQLVSSMVLGRRAVDLPPHLRDRFITVGLAHVLAASGFHVSLLLGIILRLTTRLTAKSRLFLGIGILAIYLGLTGLQASVLRACLMGSAVLLASTLETKVRPLGSLLLAAVAILIFNPLLIDDLGFKLSFLATFGLIVTLPWLQQKLDWLPRTLAILLAIPLAASIWVLPLLCYEFHTLATYSIAVNIICTPLITLVSLGGMISGIVGLILPLGGKAIAAALFYPVTWLVEIVNFFTNLPGSTRAVGQLPGIAILAIYGYLMLIWRYRWWQRRWWQGLILPLVGMTILTIVRLEPLQIAVLPAPRAPIVVVRDHGEVILLNSGDRDRAKYTVLSFLAQQGINHIDRAIALTQNSQDFVPWSVINSRTRISTLYQAEVQNDLLPSAIARQSLSSQIVTESTSLQVDQELAVANLQAGDLTWLIIGQSEADTNHAAIIHYIERQHLQTQQPILVWSGNIDPLWLQLLQPRAAISFGKQTSPALKQLIRQKQIEFYDTAAAGTVRWTPQQQFMPTAKIVP